MIVRPRLRETAAVFKSATDRPSAGGVHGPRGLQVALLGRGAIRPRREPGTVVHITLVESVADDVSRVVQAQLGQDVGAVVLDRPRADAEEAGDLPVGLSLRRERQDLSLAHGEPVALAGTTGVRARCPGPVDRERVGEPRRDVGPAPADAVDGREEVGLGVLLQDVSVRPCGHGSVEERGLLVHGEDEHFHFRPERPHFVDRLYAPETRHRDVEDHQIRGEPLEELEEVQPVVRLPDHLQPRGGLDEPPETLSEDDVIVGKDDPIRRRSRTRRLALTHPRPRSY